MTLTSAQLDELEAKARASNSRGITKLHAKHDLAEEADAILHLITAYRAALAWSDARDEAMGAAYMATSLSNRSFNRERERYQQAAAMLDAALRAIPPSTRPAYLGPLCDEDGYNDG